MGDVELPEGDERVEHRAELTDEEREAGSDDPLAQAQAILEDSEERVLHGRADDEVPEHRRSEDTVDPT